MPIPASYKTAERYIIATLFINCYITEEDISAAVALSNHLPYRCTAEASDGEDDHITIEKHISNAADEAVIEFLKGGVFDFVCENVAKDVDKYHHAFKHGGGQEHVKLYLEDALDAHALKACFRAFGRGVDLAALFDSDGDEDEVKEMNRQKAVTWARYVCLQMAGDIYEHCVDWRADPEHWELMYDNFKELKQMHESEVWLEVADLPVPKR